MAEQALSREQVREVDRLAIQEFGVPAVVLMENAGRGTAELLRTLGVGGRVVICCGKGNNGGDGFVIARHLDNWELPVEVLFFGQPDELTPESAANYQILVKAQVSMRVLGDAAGLAQAFAGADWIVDALFGTGLRGAVRAPYDQVIAAINASGIRVLAVDIPSGLDCDTGLRLGATIRAQHTATFVASKVGFANPAATEWVGQVHVIDIGCPRSAIVRARTK